MHTPRKSYSASSPVHTPLRAVSTEEVDSWSDGDSDTTLSDPSPQPADLDEPWPYTFRVSMIFHGSFTQAGRSGYSCFPFSSQAGDVVWVRTVGGNWHLGKVTGQTTRKGQTREVPSLPLSSFCHFLIFLFTERRSLLPRRI